MRIKREEALKGLSAKRALCAVLFALVAATHASATTSTMLQPQRQRAQPTAKARVKEQGSNHAPTLKAESFAAKSLNGAQLRYRILLPADYDASAHRFPVLYLLHGAGGDETDWTKRTNLAEYVSQYQLIVVMPGVGNSWYANSVGEEHARYEDAIVRDLIPHIDASYRTLANWHGRAIAGLSMGGFGAMKFALRYPHLFVFAASFSGAFDAPRTDVVANATDERSKNLLRIFGPDGSEARRRNDVFDALKSLAPATRLPYLYVATGAGDQLISVLPSNPRFADALRERKAAYEYHERPGAHDWKYWDAEVERALARMSDFLAHQRR